MITSGCDPLVARLRRQVSEVKSRVAANNHLSQAEIAAGVDAMAANFGWVSIELA
ncbi:hypothetical protein PWR05_35310 [Paraburkholderia sp. A2RI-6]|uniref:hypothetical protein n=1 Tax=Paraburkholderia sp. A2RI-6 TaxID=3028371 RepID=UPI003B77291D